MIKLSPPEEDKEPHTPQPGGNDLCISSVYFLSKKCVLYWLYIFFVDSYAHLAHKFLLLSTVTGLELLCVDKLASKPVVCSSRVVDDRLVARRGGELCRLLTTAPHLAREDKGVLCVGFGKVELRFEGFLVHVKGGHLK